MPTYDYKCGDPNCGHVHEETRRVSELDDITWCTECGSIAYYHFHPVEINVHVVGGPTHKWDSTCPFLPKRFDEEGNQIPFETPGALESYKKEHDLIDAFDIEADSPVKRYDEDTLAMEEHRKRISEQDRQLTEYNAMDPKKKIFGDPEIATVNDDGDVESIVSSTTPLIAA